MIKAPATTMGSMKETPVSRVLVGARLLLFLGLAAPLLAIGLRPRSRPCRARRGSSSGPPRAGAIERALPSKRAMSTSDVGGEEHQIGGGNLRPPSGRSGHRPSPGSRRGSGDPVAWPWSPGPRPT